MMKIKPFECPYTKNSCDKLNTATMTLDVKCSKCEHYDNGVRATGAMPILHQFIQFIFKITRIKF